MTSVKLANLRAAVLPQLPEQLTPTPEVLSLNPTISKIIHRTRVNC